MKFAVVGAGAIGAFVGASLARGGHPVTLIARGPHLEAMRRDGVRVSSPLGDFVAHPEATDDLEAVADADVVLIGLKAYSIPAMAPRLGELLSPGAAVIWGQNGVPFWYFQSFPGELSGTVLQSVDPDGVISAAIDARHNVGCVVYCATEVTEPGVIRHVEGTRFSIGEPDGTSSERCAAITEAFAAGGLKAPADGHLRDQVWLKLIGNVAFNPVSVLTGATLGELGSSMEVRELLRAVFAECALVASHLGVRFAVSLDRRLEAGLAVGDHKTSMLQDYERGRPLELDCITGAVLELARLVKVEVPHVETLHTCAGFLDLRARHGGPTG